MSARHGTLTAELFRTAMSCFASGVAVVTTKQGSELHGMTLNSLTSVCLDPPLLLVCFTSGARTAQAVRESGWFVVNVLREGQGEISNRFSRPGEDHFAGLEVNCEQYDVPILPGSLAHLVCRVRDIHVAGDHEIVVGEVVETEWHAGQPLVFFRGRYHTLSVESEWADWYW